jgi:hypothetical protein
MRLASRSARVYNRSRLGAPWKGRHDQFADRIVQMMQFRVSGVMKWPNYPAMLADAQIANLDGRANYLYGRDPTE